MARADRANSSQKHQYLAPYLIKGKSLVDEHPSGHSFTFSNQTQQDMLCAHITDALPAPLFLGELENLFGSGCKPDLFTKPGFARGNNLFYFLANLIHIDTQCL